MADNVDLAALTGLAAADEVTYSGDTTKVQLVRQVAVTGAEGSKTVVENTPASLGQKAMAASFPVVLPSDQTVPVAGNVASGSADAGNPVKVGGVAIDFESMPADVTVGDRVDAAYTPKGIAGVALFHPTLSTPLETLPVSVSSGDVSVSVIGAGDNNIGNVDVVTLPGVAGDIAHDAADSGNPLKVGAKAANALPAAVANNDRTNNISDLFGRVLTAEIDPAMQVSKAVTYTSQQTGAVIWDPTSGKRIAVTDVTIASYGTTGGRVILWFGDNADTTYSAGTDQVLEVASFVPSATGKPGLAKSYQTPVFCTTADRELHITTDAAMSVDVTLRGYEF